MCLFPVIWIPLPLLLLKLCHLRYSEAQSVSQNVTRFGTDTSRMVIVLNVGARHTEQEIVLSDGVANAHWAVACHEQSTDGNCQPYTFDRYADEVFFEFRYENSSDLLISVPKVHGSQGRSRPELVDFTHDEDAKNGEFSVWHNCNVAPAQEADQLSRITLTFQIWKDHDALTLSWMKVCGNGEHRQLDFGYYSGGLSSKHVKIPVSLRENNENPNELPTLGPRMLSTRIYLRLSDNAYSQRFDTPLISVMDENDQKETDKKLTMELRGGNHGGVVRKGIDAVFDLIYTCESHGLWRVRIEVGISPFDDVEIELVKDCGGGPAKSVSVSNDAQGQLADIVKSGETMPSYMEKAKALPGQKNWEINTVWGRGEGYKIFFLVVDGRPEKAGEGGVGIGEIVAHSENERIGTAHVVQRDGGVYNWDGLTSVRESGEVFTQLERRTLRIQVSCVKSGWMRVRVRIAVHDRTTVEWWFWNECLSKKDRGNVGPAISSTISATLLLFFTAMLLILRRNCLAPRKALLLHSRYRGGSQLGVSRRIHQPHMA